MQKNKELINLFVDYQRDTGMQQTDAAAMLTLAHCVLELKIFLSAMCKLLAGVPITKKTDPAFQMEVGLQNSTPPGGENAKETAMAEQQKGPAQATVPGVLCVEADKNNGPQVPAQGCTKEVNNPQL